MNEQPNLEQKIEILISQLKTFLPKESVIYLNDDNSRELSEKYSYDKTKNISAKADLVLIPRNTNELSEILKICNRLIIPVIPRGGGTGVTGGAAAVYGGVIISMEKFNKIIEIDLNNMVAVVEPGVLTGDISKTSSEYGLFYPPDPASLDECTIGGNIAENAGGPSAVKYGTTKDYVLGIEVVTPEGHVMNHGGKYVKNSTGYNLSGIIIGSEGTLAIITKVFLKLLPLPLHTVDVLLSFDSMDTAIFTVNEILMQRTDPAAIEFLEKDAIRLVATDRKGDIPFPEAGAHLMVQFGGFSKEEINSKLEKLFSLKNILHEKSLIAKTESERTVLWSVRRGIRPAIANSSPIFFAEDCVVPHSEIPSFIRTAKNLLNNRNIRSIFFGHAGDGNIHLDMFKDNIPDEEWSALMEDLKKSIYEVAIAHGGTITGEHGIGSIRKQYLSMIMSENQINLYKKIKQSFDPNNILNPGKVLQ